jgi:hypothetical protein
MTHEQFVQEYLGKTVGFPSNDDYLGECLSLVKHYIQDLYGIYPPASGCGAAKCYWSIFPDPLGDVFEKVPNTPELIPEEGWIAVWDKNAGGGYGHISIVLKGADIYNFTSLDQNWNGRHAHKVVHNYDNVYGFLKPKNKPENGENMSNYGNMVKKSSQWDELIGYLQLGKPEEIMANTVIDIFDRLNDTIENQKNKIKELENQQSPNNEWVEHLKEESYEENGITTTITYKKNA